MARKDLQFGQRAIRRILGQLQKPEGLEHRYAEAVLQIARQNAAGKPTPQARMAAQNLTVEGANIGPLAGGAPAEVAIGSEFGSSEYLQFHKPPNPAGYWLYPATRDPRTLKLADRSLEEVLQEAVRRG
jgi:hypothetical protein